MKKAKVPSTPTPASTPTTEYQAGYDAADKLWRESFLGLVFCPHNFFEPGAVKILQCPTCRTVYAYNAEAEDKCCPFCLNSAATATVGKLQAQTLTSLCFTRHPILSEKYVEQLTDTITDLLELIKTTVSATTRDKLINSSAWLVLTNLIEQDEPLKDYLGKSLPPIDELIEMNQQNVIPVKAINSLKALSQAIQSFPKPD